MSDTDNVNLLLETMEQLVRAKKTIEQVRWVGFAYGKNQSHMSWQEFAALANFEYDSGFGGQYINSHLLVVGKDWWLERHEYDGSEWWEFKMLPQQPLLHDAHVSLKEESEWN